MEIKMKFNILHMKLNLQYYDDFAVGKFCGDFNSNFIFKEILNM